MKIKIGYEKENLLHDGGIVDPRPNYVIFTLENGDNFRVSCFEFDGMLDISCEGVMVIRPLGENRISLYGIRV